MDTSFPLYYTIGFFERRYEINSTSSITQSYNDLASFNEKTNATALGIYDPQQQFFIWNVSPSIQDVHAKEVNRLTRILDARYQLYLLSKEEARKKAPVAAL